MRKFNEKFGKIIIPVLTPYNDDESVAYGKFAEVLEYLIGNDLCDTLLISGTTGEASLLTLQERKRLVEVAVETSAGRKPVVAGTGCASTRETIAMTNMAANAGADTVMVVAPFFNRPTQEGLFLHYKAVAESTAADVILYNIPIFTGVNIEPVTLRKLAGFKNIIGIKDESGINPTQITDYFMAVEDIDPEFAVFNGDDIMLLPTIIQGAMGIISGGAAIFGHEIRSIFQAFELGDNERARIINRKLYSFCKTLGQGGRILPNSLLRPAFEAVSGIRIGPARSPVTQATEDELAVTIAVLKKLGKI